MPGAKRQSSNHNITAKRLGRRAHTIQQQDDVSQSLIVGHNDAPIIANLEQEVRSLKFELGQQSEILALRNESLKNVQG